MTSTTSQESMVGFLILHLAVKHDHYRMEWMAPRIIRVVELYRDQFLLGKAFPPDVRCFPSVGQLDEAVSWQQV